MKALVLALLLAGGCGSSNHPVAPPPSPGGPPGPGMPPPTGGPPPTGTPEPTPAPDGSVVPPSGGADGGPGPATPPPPAGPDDLPACKRTVDVAGSAALPPALDAAMPGDCLVLADGMYTLPVINKKGTAEAPIVIRAANVLKAVVASGALKLDGAAYVVVQGLMYQSNTPVSVNDCDHCRVSRCRFQLADGGFDTLTVNGKSHDCRVDHNDFGPKNVLGNTVMLAGSGPQIVQNTRIDHNHFHDVKGGGGNGWETIRGGLSGWSFSSAHTIIEYNLFQRCTGDPETISMKSSDNILRYNTMRDNKGQMVLRHGNRTQVYGNYILSGSGGMRICGGEHKIFNNYIADVTDNAILLEGGENDDMHGMLTDHKQVYKTQVLFNTVVNSRGIAVGGSHPMNPHDCLVANNLLQGTGPLLVEVAGGVNNQFAANMVNGGAGLDKPGAVMMADPKLTRTGEIFRIAAGSPAIDAADPAYTVPDDIDGNPRTGKLDIGADELTGEGQQRGPLTEKDVGPLAP
jgi:hypothetical protein